MKEIAVCSYDQHLIDERDKVCELAARHASRIVALIIEQNKTRDLARKLAEALSNEYGDDWHKLDSFGELPDWLFND